MPTAFQAIGRGSASASRKSRSLAVCKFVRVKTADKQRGIAVANRELRVTLRSLQ